MNSGDLAFRAVREAPVGGHPFVSNHAAKRKLLSLIPDKRSARISVATGDLDKCVPTRMAGSGE
jgi:hypothetical protein